MLLSKSKVLFPKIMVKKKDPEDPEEIAAETTEEDKF
jgi:hypothetical protein